MFPDLFVCGDALHPRQLFFSHVKMISCLPGLNKQGIIRIYHECEGRIQKSALRIAIWHHEACRVMTNGDPEARIFLSYPHRKKGFFFLLTLFLFIYLF